MTKHIELKRFDQGTALTTGTLALPALVIEGLEEFKGSFDRLCLPFGGHGCVSAAEPNWSFPVGRRSRRRTCCRAGRSTRC